IYGNSMRLGGSWCTILAERGVDGQLITQCEKGKAELLSEIKGKADEVRWLIHGNLGYDSFLTGFVSILSSRGLASQEINRIRNKDISRVCLVSSWIEANWPDARGEEFPIDLIRWIKNPENN